MLVTIKNIAHSLFSRLAQGYNYVRNDAILATLAATGILALMAKYLAPASVWPWLLEKTKLLTAWFKTSHPTYGWVIVLGLLFFLAALYQAWRNYLYWKKENSKPQPPDYFRYVTDEFYGFQWRWTWEHSYSRDFKNIHGPMINEVQICPRCMGDLSRRAYNSDLLRCINVNCNYTLFCGNPRIDTTNIDEQLINQIMIKIRNGTYKDTL